MDEHDDSKCRALREHGTLHPRPERVHDPLFQNSEFFDPHDLMLVKYEMLRRVRVEGHSATQAAKVFGFSRVAFYQAVAAFQREGLPGLLPRRRGPKRATKLTQTVLEFVDLQRAADTNLRAPELARRVREHLGLSIHPRSIERALARRAKKGRHMESP
ncbi:MAG: helix-turn-helix domain-containing protein [Planctomycetota bacterium]